jgi:hypothetical protein
MGRKTQTWFYIKTLNPSLWVGFVEHWQILDFGKISFRGR